MPSLSRRRVVTAAGILVATWLLLSFARQVGEASAASDRADALRDSNAAMRDEVAQLQLDLTRVTDRNYILLAGRSYGLGGPGEIPFALEAGAPSLPPDAPGSASVRLGARHDDGGPLDAWLDALFGSGG
jgi:cell division protein FtsB